MASSPDLLILQALGCLGLSTVTVLGCFQVPPRLRTQPFPGGFVSAPSRWLPDHFLRGWASEGPVPGGSLFGIIRSLRSTSWKGVWGSPGVSWYPGCGSILD